MLRDRDAVLRTSPDTSLNQTPDVSATVPANVPSADTTEPKTVSTVLVDRCWSIIAFHRVVQDGEMEYRAALIGLSPIGVPAGP